VQSIVARTQAIRTQTNRHFTRHHQGWIDRERAQGSSNPARDVFARHQGRVERINNAEQHLIRQAFKKHGHSLPERQEKTLSYDFSQMMG